MEGNVSFLVLILNKSPIRWPDKIPHEPYFWPWHTEPLTNPRDPLTNPREPAQTRSWEPSLTNKRPH